MGLVRLQRTAMPSGSVIQTVTKESSAEETTTSNTHQDTSLTLSITPTRSDSKIFAVASFNAGSATASGAAVLYLFRDSTEITMQGGNYGSGAGSDFGGHCLSVLDSPSTTSSVTYTVKFLSNVNGHDVRFNTNFGNVTGEKAHLTLMEIAG